MNAARTDDSRRIDWSGVAHGPAALITQVTRFVGGIRGTRKEGVRTTQILAWFHGTPPDFVQNAIGDACAQGKIRCCMRSLGSNQRANGGYVYVVDEPAEVSDSATVTDLPKSQIQAVAFCSECAALRARAEQAEAQLAEAQAQLAALQTHRAARKRRKVPDVPSSDWLLVEEIRDLLHLSVGDLAARLGLTYSTVLGKAQERPLSPGLREKLHALKREHLAASAPKP